MVPVIRLPDATDETGGCEAIEGQEGAGLVAVGMLNPERNRMTMEWSLPFRIEILNYFHYWPSVR